MKKNVMLLLLLSQSVVFACTASIADGDSGADILDSGKIENDSGHIILDSGVAPVDSGVAPVDSGVAPVDSGVVPVDSGVVPVDSGVVPVDSGVAPVDSGISDAALTTMAEKRLAVAEIIAMGFEYRFVQDPAFALIIKTSGMFNPDLTREEAQIILDGIEETEMILRQILEDNDPDMPLEQLIDFFMGTVADRTVLYSDAEIAAIEAEARAIATTRIYINNMDSDDINTDDMGSDDINTDDSGSDDVNTDDQVITNATMVDKKRVVAQMIIDGLEFESFFHPAAFLVLKTDRMFDPSLTTEEAQTLLDDMDATEVILRQILADNDSSMPMEQLIDFYMGTVAERLVIYSPSELEAIETEARAVAITRIYIN